MNRFASLVICALALGIPTQAGGTAAPWSQPVAASCSVTGTICGVLTEKGRLWMSFDNGATFPKSFYLRPIPPGVDPPTAPESTSGVSQGDRDRERLPATPGLKSPSEVPGLLSRTPRLETGSDGSFVASFGNSLYYGHRGKRSQRLDNVNVTAGPVIDPDGFLWWIADDLLTRFDPTTGRSIDYRLATGSVHSLAATAESSTLILVDERGLWRVRLDDQTGAVDREPILLDSNISLGVPRRGHAAGFYFVRNNYLEQLNPRGITPHAAVPPRCKQLVANGDYIFLRCGASWYQITGRQRKRTELSAVAITSVGQALLIGPTTSRLVDGTRATSKASWNHRLSRGLVLQSLARLDAVLGPPPCEPPTRSLLPSVKLFAEISQGRGFGFGFSDATNAVDRTVFSGGVLLSFRIQPNRPARCLEEGERWQRFRRRTAEKIRAYTREWIAQHPPLPAELSLEESIRNFIEIRKIHALIALYTHPQTVPNEERIR